MALGALQYAILRSLADRPDDAYGTSIQERVSGSGGVFSVLRDLERKGFVESHQGELFPKQRGRRRVYYAITNPGREAMRTTQMAFGIHKIKEGTSNE